MNRRQKIIVSVTGIFIVLLILIGLTYGYFLTRITGNPNNESISVTTANLELVYGDGTTSILTSNTPIEPGKFTSSKDFTVTNNGNTLTDYAVTLEDFSITYASDTVINGQTVSAGTVTKLEYPTDMEMTITCTIESDDETRDGTACGNVDGTLPTENSIIYTNSIEVDDIHNYVLTLTYEETGTDQSLDMNKTIKGKIDIIDPKSTIDLEGSVATYQTGDYVEINSNPIKSEIVDGAYKLIGVEPGSHTLYVKYKDANGEIQTRGSQSLTIKKGNESSVSGNIITFTDASRIATVDVTSSYELDISETIDLYNPTPAGTLAFTFNNGNSLNFTTNTIVEDRDIKTNAISLPFSVTNIGDSHMKLTIKIADISMDEALKNIDFRWGLYNATSGNGLSFGTFKYTGNEEIVYRDVVLDAVDPNPTQNFILRIWVHNNGTAQTELLNKSFKGTVQVIGERVEYTPVECFELFDLSEIGLSGKVQIDSYDISCGEEVLVPANMNGLEVFDSANAIENITTVLSSLLGNSFFPTAHSMNSTKVKHITIPENLDSISELAFDYSQLESLFIPETNIIIDNGSFADSKIEQVILPGTVNINNAYAGFGNNLITDLIIMDGITTLPDYIFDGLYAPSIEIPASVTNISEAFSNPKGNYLKKIIVRGKTEAPTGFVDGWNISGYNFDVSPDPYYAEVEFRP